VPRARRRRLHRSDRALLGGCVLGHCHSFSDDTLGALLWVEALVISGSGAS